MVTNPADVLLQEYADCADPERSESLLDRLVVEHALPAIRKIVRHKLGFQGAAEAQDAEDVASEVVVELISRLRTLKAGPPDDSIGAFSGYAAVAAYHGCNEYLRRKYPNRHRLKTRLRYLLTNDKRFAMWEDPRGEWMCGLSEWQAKPRPPADAGDLAAGVSHGRGRHPADVVAQVLKRAGGPVAFDDLVGAMARIWAVNDPPPAPEDAAREIESADTDPASRLDLQRWMAALWAQIRELPVAQRIALLLNLRAGSDGAALALLPLTGVASMREISDALEMPAAEFASLWRTLPLDDLAIAERLGVARQRVINLRKSARERLVRRMGAKSPLSMVISGRNFPRSK